MSAIIYNILIELDARLAAGRVRERERRERGMREQGKEQEEGLMERQTDGRERGQP